MPGVREIFGSDEFDSEDDESDAQRSQAHAISGPSDPLFVGDLDADLAMLAGGEYHGTVTLARMAPNSVSAAPRRDGTGFERRADDELSERSAARSEGLGVVHATSPTAPTVPQVRRSAFLAATAQMAGAAEARATARMAHDDDAGLVDRPDSSSESAGFSCSGSDDDDNDGSDESTSPHAGGASGSAAPGPRQNRQVQKGAARTVRASERSAREARLKASRGTIASVTRSPALLPLRV